MNKLIFTAITVIVLSACTESPPPNTFIEAIPKDTVTASLIDTLLTVDTLKPIHFIEETIELTNLNKNLSLASYIDYVQEKMDKVDNPVRATYEGTDIGDYLHISFLGKDELYLDFADVSNDFGEYILYDSITFDENKKYVGKTFDIYWEYKISTFACCEGEMELVTAIVPSIVQLQLIKD